MEFVQLNNGIKMPMLGYGVYQVTKREFDEKRIEKTAGICYNENNYKLQKQKGGFFYGTNSNFL